MKAIDLSTCDRKSFGKALAACKRSGARYNGRMWIVDEGVRSPNVEFYGATVTNIDDDATVTVDRF